MLRCKHQESKALPVVDLKHVALYFTAGTSAVL